MPQSIEMTRQQLYDLVWSRSMGDAARPAFPSPARALLIHLIQSVHFRWLSGAGTLFRKIRKRQ
jgi:hypothetical protein